jgi:hypothetical protein
MKNLFVILFLCSFIAITSCAIEPSGKVSGKTETMASFEEFVKKGVTTKEQLIEKYGDPSASTKASMGMEVLTFAEKAPFWESGTSSLFMGRQKVRYIVVTLSNGVVEDYTISESWQKRK